MDLLNCVFMNRAFELAKKGLNTTMPNPRVGCVIVKDGKIVGEGYHRWTGQDHAEIIAIKSAGEKTRSSSMYITLEPCSFKGKTGPCTDEILRSGIKEVIVASSDPNPLVEHNIHFSGPVPFRSPFVHQCEQHPVGWI